MDAMIRDIRQTPKAKGADRVRVPGEMEWDKRREALANGIPLPEDVRASPRCKESLRTALWEWTADLVVAMMQRRRKMDTAKKDRRHA